MQATRFVGIDDAKSKVGQEIGVSEWMLIDQARVNGFAEVTGDHQWIHVDVERAKRESPFGGPIAHGYLTVSLLAKFAGECIKDMKKNRKFEMTEEDQFDFESATCCHICNNNLQKIANGSEITITELEISWLRSRQMQH